MAIYGYPHDWIRTLGKRIVKLHFKDFNFRKSVTSVARTSATARSTSWRSTRRWRISGIRAPHGRDNGGDTAYLKDVNQRVEKILSGAVEPVAA